MKDKKRKKKQENIDDDNRVIANMNIDGMPMNTRPRISSPRNSSIDSMNRESEEPVQRNDLTPELSKKELRQITRSATLAGLLIGIVFIVVFFLFIMFSIHIWF